MSNQPLVSVIVPIYNCQDVLNRCIDALVNQSYMNLEIILVNDGSKDKSGEICEKYAENHRNISYIYQENQGVSVARNTGLKHATGKYFAFCDADDYYCLDAIEQLVECAEEHNADITCGGVKKIFSTYIDYTTMDDFLTEKTQDDFGKYIFKLTENFLINSPFAKLYRVDLVKENEIYFNKSLRCGEDLEWNCRVFQEIDKLSGISEVVYNYCIENEESLSLKFAKDYFERINISFSALVSLYTSLNIFEDYEQELWTRQELNIWRGFLKINDENCYLTTKEKKQYIRSGLQSSSFCKFKRRKKHYLSIFKRFVLLTKNETVIYFVVSMFGKMIGLKSRMK